jgi:diguanylate cyclase (GGDEF)-like protein
MTPRRLPARVAPPLPRLRSVTRLAMLFLALVCLSLLAVQGWSSYSARQTYLDAANTSTVNMARALADHADASINLVDVMLVGIVERVQNNALVDDPERLHALLMELVRKTPSLQGLLLYDAEGRWILNSLPGPPPNANNSDREYFEYHRTHRDKTAHVGSPVLSRSSGVWVVPVSRRLENPDGSFAGVALATIKVEFFKDYYESFAIGEKGTIFLVSDSGRFVVRRPFYERDFGVDISSGPLFSLWREKGTVTGSAIMRAKIDGVERLYTYRHLPNYPLLIAVALAKDEVLARWRTSAMAALAGTSCLIVLLLFLGARMIGQLIERDRLQRQLRAATAALETTNASLQQLAMSDGLTGLANRRHFDDRLNAEFKRAVRDQSPLALVILDVDYFKKFNDRHGHVAGDACLREVAEAVQAGQHRPGDIAARFGGEEFTILLPDTDLAGARLVAEKVRAAIAAMAMVHDGSPFHIVTVSAGVHALVPARGDYPRTLVEAADRGLYQAKAEGRNRVCAAPPYENNPQHAA